MPYLINEIFYSVQGEGRWAGRPAVFIRFARCNLWTGREADRSSAVCQFCDTDFIAANLRFPTARDLVAHVLELLPDNAWHRRTPMVVLTGGEPTLQVDRQLVTELLAVPLYVAIETNGTRPLPCFVDWVCVSPKAGTTLATTVADEVKLVYPQPDLLPDLAEGLISADSYCLQPMAGPHLAANTAAAFEYCLAHPQWSLSLQTHKMIGAR